MAGKISVFNFVSVDGYFTGPNGEIDWFKFIKKDDEFDRYTHEQSSRGEGILVFGLKTYEMMKSYWPTPEAIESDPKMARVLNNREKIVFSKTLKGVEDGPNWKNIRIFHEIKPKEIMKIKNEDNKGIMILGSGEIVQQFSSLGLIDEYVLVVVPVILGSGKSMFKDVKNINLELLESGEFKNGLVLLRYKPA